jgi:hypothetical protein
MAGVTWKKLPFEWKMLVGAFIASSIILFVLAIQLMGQAKTCETDSCVIGQLTTFSWVAFSLLILNVGVLVMFMFSFFVREASKKPKRRSKTLK